MLRILIVVSLALLVPVVRAAEPGSRVDVFGDPLPPGALMRLGTTRLRHETVVGFSADGRELTTAGHDGYVCFWDIATGRLLGRRRLELPTDRASHPLSRLVASENGAVLAGRFGDALALWDAATGRRLRSIADVAADSRVALSADGRSVAASFFVAKGRRTGVWDVESGRKRCQFSSFMFGNRSAFSRDGTMIAAAGSPVRSTATGEECFPSRDSVHTQVTGIAFHGTTLATTNDGRLEVRDIATDKALLSDTDDGDPCTAVAFDPAGTLLAVGRTASLALWDAKTWKVVRRMPTSPVHFLRFSRDGQRLAAWSRAIAVWDVTTGRRLTPDLGPEFPAEALFALPGGHTLLAASAQDPTVRLWNVASGRVAASSPQPEAPGTRLVAAAADGSSFAAVHASASVLLGNAKSGAAEGRLPLKAIRIAGVMPHTYAAALALDRQNVVVFWETHGAGGFEGQLLVFDAKTLAERQRHVLGARLRAPRFSADAARLAAIVDERAVGVWEASTAKRVALLRSDIPLREPLALSPDGRLVAVGTKRRDDAPEEEEPLVLLWDVATGEIVARCRADAAHAAFSPDGRYLAVALLTRPERE